VEQKQPSDTVAILSDVKQLLVWAPRGMVIAGPDGAGYWEQALEPRQITYVSLPVSTEQHFPPGMGRDFPVLIEANEPTLANRCALSMSDVRAIHFRTESQRDDYVAQSFQQFGMADVALVVSPEVFGDSSEGMRADVGQPEFDEALLDRLEALAGVHLLVKHVASTQADVEFLRALTEPEIALSDDLLASLAAVVNGSDPESPTDVFLLATCIAEVMLTEVWTSKSSVDPEASLAVLNRVEQAIGVLKFSQSEFSQNVLERFDRMRQIVSGGKAFKPILEDAPAEYKLVYALLIALMRPGPKDFLFWLEKEQASPDIRLASAVLVGLRNHRRRIMERKLRSGSDDSFLSRAISVSMSESSPHLKPAEAFYTLPKSAAKASASDSSDTQILLTGFGLHQVAQTVEADGSFTIKIVADSIDPGPSSGSLAAGQKKLPRSKNQTRSVGTSQGATQLRGSLRASKKQSNRVDKEPELDLGSATLEGNRLAREEQKDD